MFFIGFVSLSLFKSDIWAYILGLCVYYFKLNQYLINYFIFSDFNCNNGSVVGG